MACPLLNTTLLIPNSTNSCVLLRKRAHLTCGWNNTSSTVGHHADHPRLNRFLNYITEISTWMNHLAACFLPFFAQDALTSRPRLSRFGIRPEYLQIALGLDEPTARQLVYVSSPHRNQSLLAYGARPDHFLWKL